MGLKLRLRRGKEELKDAVRNVAVVLYGHELLVQAVAKDANKTAVHASFDEVVVSGLVGGAGRNAQG